jgi:hypothetical protein
VNTTSEKAAGAAMNAAIAQARNTSINRRMSVGS